MAAQGSGSGRVLAPNGGNAGAVAPPPAPPAGAVKSGRTQNVGGAEDVANYFCAYASLYHQKQMLADHLRMNAYHSAIMSNVDQFKDKVVLDVGTGSGVLAMWAAQAGAKKVYAVEFTDMAKSAKKLVEKNGLGGIVEVIQTTVEKLELPCKVDIIVSEWMGYFLLRESMLDSLIRARDKFMKVGGAMYPSHATMYIGLVKYEQDRLRKMQDCISSMQEWHSFKDETQRYYNLDMSAIEKGYETEQESYFLGSGFWTELQPRQIVGDEAMIATFDLNTCTMEEAAGVTSTNFSFDPIEEEARISGYAGWFTVDFRGSEQNPASEWVTLSTAPENGYTHWGQQVFYFKEACDVWPRCSIEGSIALTRQDSNKRLYDVKFSHTVTKVARPDEDEEGSTHADDSREDGEEEGEKGKKAATGGKPSEVIKWSKTYQMS